MHNVNGCCTVIPFITLVLFAFLERDRDPAFAKVLFWIGAPTGLLLSICKVRRSARPEEAVPCCCRSAP